MERLRVLVMNDSIQRRINGAGRPARVGPRYSETGSGLADHPTGLSEHPNDMLPFHLLQRTVARRFQRIGQAHRRLFDTSHQGWTALVAILIQQSYLARDRVRSAN